MRRPVLCTLTMCSQVWHPFLNTLDLPNGSFDLGRIELNLNWVMFWIKRYFRLVRFRLSELRNGRFRVNLIFDPISLSYKNKQFCQKFWTRYGSVQVNSDFGPIFEWAYFKCQVGYESDHSVQVLGHFARSRTPLPKGHSLIFPFFFLLFLPK